MSKNILRNIGLFLLVIGLGLFIFVGIIFWTIYFKEGIISLKFVLIYTLYVIYVLIASLNSSLTTGYWKIDNVEGKINLTKLKMNHSLAISIPFILASFQFLSIEILGSEKWHLFLVGLLSLMFFLIWFIKGYYLRYLKLKKHYEKKKK